jgi:hypothetical protein
LYNRRILAKCYLQTQREKYMKLTLLAAMLATTIGTASFAQEATVTVDTTAVKVGSADVTYSIDVGADLELSVTDTVSALVSVDLEVADVAADTSAIELTNWAIGATVNDVTVTVGEQSDLYTESLMNELAGLIGYDSVTEDWTNIQVAGTFDLAPTWTVNAVMDYQNVSEAWAVGADVSGAIGDVTTDVAVTYTDIDQALGYEVAVGYRMGTFGLTGFAGGSSNTDTVDYVGAAAMTNIDVVNVWAETVYDLDSEETAVAAGVSFTF